jgi:hypothetical protein
MDPQQTSQCQPHDFIVYNVELENSEQFLVF